MRARDIVGKTVASIEQHEVSCDGFTRRWSLDVIRFTDGTTLHLDGADYGDDQLVSTTIVKPQRKDPTDAVT